MTVPPWERDVATGGTYAAPPPPVTVTQPIPAAPVSALDPATGQMVAVDVPDNLRDALGQAIAGSMSDAAAAVTTKATAVEASLQGGPVTTRTFKQGLAVDLSLAAAAVVATTTSGTFDPFSKEAWVILGLLLVKTLVQTGLSYATKVVL